MSGTATAMWNGFRRRAMPLKRSVGPHHPADQRHRGQHPAEPRDHIVQRRDHAFAERSANCANAIASSAQTVTSTSSAMAPMSLRVRMVMTGLLVRVRRLTACRRSIWSAPVSGNTPNEHASTRRASSPRHPALALRRRGAGLRDGAGRRRDAADRIRPLDRRMEAGDRRAAADERNAPGRRNSRNTRRSRNTSSSTAA